MYRSRALLAALAAAAFLVLAPRVACTPANAAQAAPAAQQDMPEWLRRGLPGAGHAALEPLIGTWHVQFSLYATLGRGVDEPPIVSDDITCRRQWVAGGRYIEDATEGTVAGEPYWRKGWLGYSNMDERYEWVT